MSIIKEYLELIPKGIKNIDKVIEGVKNQVKIELGNIPEEHLSVITARRIICDNCPYLSTNAIKLGIHKTDRVDEHCIMCGCNKLLKTASLESTCGIEVYNHDKEEKDKLTLKWNKYEHN